MTILNTEALIASEAWEKRNTPSGEHLRNVIEAAKLLNEGMSGRNPIKKAMLHEALSTSDFNVLLGQAFDRELLANYQALAPEWQKIARATTVKDFKPKTFVELFGGRDAFDRVLEGSEYEARSKDEAEYKINVGKYGNIFKVTFELIKNDELDGLKALPNDLAAAAVATEDKAAFEAFVTATGPSTAFFKAGNGNAPSNKKLTRDNLKAAYVEITKRKDKEGLPVRLAGEKLNLIVPPALEMEAEFLVNTPTMPDPAGGNVSIANPLYGKFDVIVSYWAARVNTSANVDTTWYLLPKPTNVRPALAVAKMRGQENPDLRVKADQGQRLGGGSIPFEEGSFGTDTIQYRGRHIVGAAALSPLVTYASTGTTA